MDQPPPASTPVSHSCFVRISGPVTASGYLTPEGEGVPSILAGREFGTGPCVTHADIGSSVNGGWPWSFACSLFCQRSSRPPPFSCWGWPWAAGRHLFTGAAAGSTVGVFAWGDNSSGELGDGNTSGSSLLHGLFSLPSGVTPTAIAGGGGTRRPTAFPIRGVCHRLRRAPLRLG